MYGIIFLLQIIKSANPYFRKHVLWTLDTHDFLFINALLIFIFTCFYFVYLYCIEPKMITKTLKNYYQLDLYQHISILLLAAVTTISAFYYIEFDKNYNTPIINNMFLKIVSVIVMLLLGIFLFEEKYTYSQICGFFMVALGLYCIYNKKIF